jgi:hypothetical protein
MTEREELEHLRRLRELEERERATAPRKTLTPAVPALRNPRALDFERLEYAPTVGMGTGERLIAGYGSAAPRFGRSLANLIGALSDEEYRERQRLDEALLGTPAGQTGEFLGMTGLALPLTRLPGATTMTGGAAYGGAYGLGMPAQTPGQRMGNVALSALGGGLANKLAAGTANLRNLRPAREGRLLDPQLDEMIASGYRVTPVEAKAGLVPEIWQGVSGSAKLERLNSARNQKNTNRLIAEQFGVAQGGKLTPEHLERLRKSAGQAYEQVKSSAKTIKPDQKFQSDLADLRGDISVAAREYPELVRNNELEKLVTGLDRPASPRAMVELTRKLRSDAAANLRAFDDPVRQELGRAQRKAAGAIENLIDRALTSVGKTGLVEDWRKARTLIAQTYDAESALNEATGNISARTLAKLHEKGEPLTGNMEKVARFARAYRGSAKDIDVTPDVVPVDAFDVLAGAGGGLLADSMLGFGLTAARPISRYLMSSRLMQRAFPRPREIRLSDLRNIDAVSRAALPLTLGGLSVRRPEE